MRISNAYDLTSIIATFIFLMLVVAGCLVLWSDMANSIETSSSQPTSTSSSYQKSEVDGLLLNKADKSVVAIVKSDIVTLQAVDVILQNHITDIITPVTALQDEVAAVRSDIATLQTGVYSKDDVDNAFLLKRDILTSYSKLETDLLLVDKVDSDEVYTKTESNLLLVDKADKSEVYTKSESDVLTIPTLPAWGRILVGSKYIKFGNSSTFSDEGEGFNLSATLINTQVLRFTFTTYRPNNTSYVLKFNGDLDHTKQQFIYAIYKTTSYFDMRLELKNYAANQAYDISVYHDSMVLV
jgi:hypothetical protein